MAKTSISEPIVKNYVEGNNYLCKYLHQPFAFQVAKLFVFILNKELCELLQEHVELIRNVTVK